MHPIPLTEIDPTALLRDRTALDPAALKTLQTSIQTEGLRMPVEVWKLSTPRPPYRYGLISGLRRLTACRSLGPTKIPAFLRTPAAMAAMVSGNEIRAQITPWEKGTLIIATVEEGHFDTPDAATAALYPALPRQARARLRAFAMVVEALAGALTTPERLTATRMERLASAIRGGTEDLLHAALIPLRGENLESQWSALLPILTEPIPHETTPGRPRRLLHLHQGLTIRREKTRTGYALHFSGREARKGGLIDDVLDKVEEWFQRE